MRTTEGTPTQEHTRSQKNATVHNGEPVTSAPTKQQYSILRNLAGVSIDSQNLSNRVPKGVQFLPFGKGQSNLSSLHLDALSMEKQRNANGTKHQYLGGHEEERQKSVKQSGHKPPKILLDENNSSKEATGHPCSDPPKASLPVDSIATPGSIHTQREVSEASRILQEFLFSAGS